MNEAVQEIAKSKKYPVVELYKRGEYQSFRHMKELREKVNSDTKDLAQQAENTFDLPILVDR